MTLNDIKKWADTYVCYCKFLLNRENSIMFQYIPNFMVLNNIFGVFKPFKIQITQMFQGKYKTSKGRNFFFKLTYEYKPFKTYSYENQYILIIVR